MKWDDVKINTEISKDSVYKKMDSEKEVFSVFEENNSLSKRTSDVAYFSNEKINLKDNSFSKLNNCRAHFFKSDTLFINIGLGNGFGGSGFIIRYKNKKFYTESYYSTDVIIEGEIKPVHKIIYQKLILDKSSYKIGDSLYGKIEFKSIEKDSYGNRKEHFGKGNFRSKVTEIKEI